MSSEIKDEIGAVSSPIHTEIPTSEDNSSKEVNIAIENSNNEATFSLEDSTKIDNSSDVTLEKVNSENVRSKEECDMKTESECIEKTCNEELNGEGITAESSTTQEVLTENQRPAASSDHVQHIDNSLCQEASPKEIANSELSTTEEKAPVNVTSESLRIIQKYNSDTSDSSDSDSTDSEEDSDSDSDEDSSDSEDGDDMRMIDVDNKNKKKPEEESWLSVLGVDSASTELPDISSLNLNDKEEFIHIGNLESIIETIVTVAALPHLPAYDLDSLLFLDEGRKVLGYVFDVMGPVKAPVYIVQMSSVEKIKELELQKGTKVYCAPRSQYTKFVLLQELMQIRGSDASWVGDMEVPIELQEFSDDEQERQSKAPKKENKRKRSQERKQEPPTMDRLPQGGPSSHNTNRTPTQNKNNSNQNHQQARFSRSNFRNSPQVVNRSPNPQNWNVVNPFAVNARNAPSMPAFDPSVPPPNFRAPSFSPVQRHILPTGNGFMGPRNFSPRGPPFRPGCTVRVQVEFKTKPYSNQKYLLYSSNSSLSFAQTDPQIKVRKSGAQAWFS